MARKEYYLFAKNIVASLGGSSEDLEEVYLEAFTTLDRSIRAGKFQQKSSIYTYYCAIVKNYAQKTIGKYAKEIPFENDSNVFKQEFDYINDFNQKNLENSVIVSEILGLMEKKCKQLVHLHVLDYSFEEIKEELNFPSAAAARVAFSRCNAKTLAKIKVNEKLKLLISNLKLNLTKNE